MASFTPQQIEEFLQEFFDVVGTRQYIGARYIPLFGRRGESSIDWDNSAPYEPLTIVMYQGNTYTSRTYVPAGIQIDNEDYWARTGNYNAQVELYRAEVIQLQNEWVEYKEDTQADIDRWLQDTTDNINDQLSGIPRVAIYIGNSYTDGVGSPTYQGLYARTKNLFHEAHKFTTGGNGFGTYTDHDTTFYNQLQAAAADTSFQNALVTDVIFVSAMGDTRSICEGHETLVTSGIESCRNYIKNNFPNATMHVCYAEMVYGRDTQASYSDFYYMAQMRVDYIFKQVCGRLGINYMGWLGWYPNNMPGYNAADNYHPNDNGYNLLTSAFLNSWFGDDPYKLVKKFTLTNPNNTVMVTFTAKKPGECDVNMYQITKDLLPASIAQMGVYDVAVPIVSPTYLPPFVPFIPAENPLTLIARFSSEKMTLGIMRVNGQSSSSPDRTMDFYPRFSFTDALDNSAQSGTMYLSGTHHVNYHVQNNITQFTED